MAEAPVIAFGWSAPPLKEQFPQLDADMAAHFDRDREAMIRLHVRGLMTDSQRDAVVRKMTQRISIALAANQEDPRHAR